MCIENLFIVHIKNGVILAYRWSIKMYTGLQLINLFCVLAYHLSFALYDVFFIGTIKSFGSLTLSIFCFKNFRVFILDEMRSRNDSLASQLNVYKPLLLSITVLFSFMGNSNNKDANIHKSKADDNIHKSEALKG